MSLSVAFKAYKLIELASDEGKSQPLRQQGCDASGKLWLQHSLDLMRFLESDDRHVEMLLEADGEIKTSRQDALTTIVSLRNVSMPRRTPFSSLISCQISGERLDVARGIEMVLSLVLLQTYDETEDSLDMLEVRPTLASALMEANLGTE